ncbi:MAG: DUF4340 domain-containing protein [Spirochaetaceae bacterium]|jgi:hypothetical protein|nr:DUF4340 domain-containing protein [Spirochaetaceae bacterium]
MRGIDHIVFLTILSERMILSYKNKILTLSALCGALLIAFILTIVFDPENSAARGAFWTALDPKFKDKVNLIRLDGEDKVQLIRNNGRWFVNFEDSLYPARQNKVDDMINVLSRRGSYPVRSRSEVAQEKLMLTEAEAQRIIINDGDDNTLLDVLVGAPDATLKEIYIRLSGNKEIRSGKDVFSPLFVSRQGWYDLRLFPDHEAEGLTVSSVQRVVAQPPALEVLNASIDGEDASSIPIAEAYTLIRDGNGWKLEDSGEIMDSLAVEAYIRRIIDFEANDFTSALRANDPAFTQPSASSGRLVLETGDGKRRIITIGPVFADKYGAAVSGSPYVYLLADWQLARLFDKLPLATK